MPQRIIVTTNAAAGTLRLDSLPFPAEAYKLGIQYFLSSQFLLSSYRPHRRHPQSSWHCKGRAVGPLLLATAEDSPETRALTGRHHSHRRTRHRDRLHTDDIRLTVFSKVGTLFSLFLQFALVLRVAPFLLQNICCQWPLVVGCNWTWGHTLVISAV